MLNSLFYFVAEDERFLVVNVVAVEGVSFTFTCERTEISELSTDENSWRSVVCVFTIWQ